MEQVEKQTQSVATIRDEASQLFQYAIAVNVEDATTPKTEALPKNSPKKESATNS